ncbi:hypothetical protein [Longimicrobium sp.]|uniref:hypothetical protein n=1 Tax=Longimicrobium sp. TaxID=2029185 RepID=UPI002CB86159|nr:hypothetical protein [Longimicrobium sp.]HSU16629.1 hypothetical protein [Longimicrobium sp.]
MRAILSITLGAVLLAGCESPGERRLRTTADRFVQHFQTGDESQYASLPGYADTLQALATRVRAGEFAEKDGDAYAADLLSGARPQDEYALMRAFIIRQQARQEPRVPSRPRRADSLTASRERLAAEQRARMRSAQWDAYARKMTECVRAHPQRRAGPDSARTVEILNPGVDSVRPPNSPCPREISAPQP